MNYFNKLNPPLKMITVSKGLDINISQWHYTYLLWPRDCLMEITVPIGTRFLNANNKFIVVKSTKIKSRSWISLFLNRWFGLKWGYYKKVRVEPAHM